MLNSKAFKKLAALTAAVALVGSFAVSASAAVVTTTEYFGEGQIKVAVSVTDLAADAEVTYYAEKDGTPYHVDQAKAVSGTATFDTFVTSEANLNATVLVNGAEKAITGRTISYNDAVLATIPTAEAEKVVTITPVLTEGYVVDTITANGATAVATPGNDGAYNVTLSAFTAEAVEIIVTEKKAPVVVTPVATFIDSGWVKEGNGFKITVLGSVKDLADGAEFGAKINGASYKSYAEGEYFAIQLISETLEVGEYVTAVYATGATDAAGETLNVQ